MRLEILEEVRTLYENKQKRVKLVYHPFEQRYYVLKMLYPPYQLDIYRVLQASPHPGIARIYEVKEYAGYCLILEEFINGVTLEYEMSARAFTKEEILGIMRELLDAVEQLHQLSPPIIHRDIKPSNLMLEHKHCKVIDFEIARSYQKQRSRDTTLLGSEGYAAPEQYGFSQTDPRTDIYAIGVVFQELLANGHIVDEKYQQVISTCLAMDKEQRYASIQELRSAIFSKRKAKRASLWWYAYDANAVVLGIYYAVDMRYKKDLLECIFGGILFFVAFFLVHAMVLDLWGIRTSFIRRPKRHRFLYYLQFIITYIIAFLVISYILFLSKLILQSLLSAYQ